MYHEYLKVFDGAIYVHNAFLSTFNISSSTYVHIFKFIVLSK